MRRVDSRISRPERVSGVAEASYGGAIADRGRLAVRGGGVVCGVERGGGEVGEAVAPGGGWANQRSKTSNNQLILGEN